MTFDLLGAWAAALAIDLWAVAVLCAYRAVQMVALIERRRLIGLLGVGLFCAAIAYQQTFAFVMLATDHWVPQPNQHTSHVFAYRALMTVAMLLIAGWATHERCGHKGWLSVLALGALAFAGAFALM